MKVDLCNEDSSLWPEKDKKNYLFDAYHVKSYEPISTTYINWNLGLGGRQGYNPASDMF
jgi:hypothetical protein